MIGIFRLRSFFDLKTFVNQTDNNTLRSLNTRNDDCWKTGYIVGLNESTVVAQQIGLILHRLL